MRYLYVILSGENDCRTGGGVENGNSNVNGGGKRPMRVRDTFSGTGVYCFSVFFLSGSLARPWEFEYCGLRVNIIAYINNNNDRVREN